MNNRCKTKFKSIIVLIDNNLHLPIDITLVYNNIDTLGSIPRICL